MSYWRQFDSFDPKLGSVPDHPFPSLPHIVTLARWFLKNRTKDEIIAAAQGVDAIIEEYFARNLGYFIQHQIESNGWAKEHLLKAEGEGKKLEEFVEQELSSVSNHDEIGWCRHRNNTTDTHALEECIEEYDLNFKGFPDAEQYECFAVLALWLVGDCLHNLSKASINAKVPDSGIALAGESAINATYALYFAERYQMVQLLRESEFALEQQLANQKNKSDQQVDLSKKSALGLQVEQKVAQLRSEQSREAAYKSHERHRELKQKAIDLYEQNKSSYPSVADAAHKIQQQVPFAERTIYKWLLDHNKIITNQ